MAQQLWIVALMWGIVMPSVVEAQGNWFKAGADMRRRHQPILVAGVNWISDVLPHNVQRELVRVNTRDMKGLRKMAIRLRGRQPSTTEFLQLLQFHAPNVLNLGTAIFAASNRAIASAHDRLAESQDARGFVQLAGGMIARGLRDARESAKARGPEAEKKITEMFPNLLPALEAVESLVRSVTQRLTHK